MCITIDPPEKIPGGKPESEVGCIFENFPLKQGNSLKILVEGTRNHRVSLPPSPRERNNYFSAVCNSIRLCGNFHVGAFQVNISLLTKFPAQTTRTTNKSCPNF